MPFTRFKVYTPGDKPYSRRRTDEEWETHHQLLSEMHTQRYTRREMLAKLKKLGFEVSPGQLLSQMKKWDMMVNGERASQSSSSSQQSPNTTTTETPRLRVVNSDDVGEISIHDSALTSTDDLPLYPLSVEGSTEPLRRLPVTELSDPTLDGLSFSSIEDTNDTHDELCQDNVSGALSSPPPPEYSLEDPAIFQRPIPLLEVEIADPSSILRHLSTITEPWCGNFPTTCCCNALFLGKDGFAKSPSLYNIILDQSDPQSLMYIMALLNIAGTKPTGDGLTTLRRRLREVMEFYLQLCTRVDYKNKLAPHILHRLIRVWEDVSDGHDTQFPGPELTRYHAVQTNEVLFRKIFRTRPSSNPRGKAIGDSLRAVNWHGDAERDVGCVVGFTVRKPSTFPLLNCDGEVFGSTSSWCSLGEGLDETQTSLSKLLPTAKHIASYMHSQWYNGLVMHTAYDLGDCDLRLIFTALGLMIALEATSSAHNLIESDEGSSEMLNINSWAPGIRAFIETTISTLSLNADYADKFRKAYWLIRCDKIGHLGKTVHMGEACTATHEWEVLERDIHAYDEERTWIERRIFSGRSNSNPDSNVNTNEESNTWSQADPFLPVPTHCDTMSLRSTSSFNSFRRFQALALHLKIGTPMSRSLKSRSTRSQMSTESHLSWQLEQMLDIRDDNDDHIEKPVADQTGKQNSSTESAGLCLPQIPQLDELAFEQMQITRE